MTKSTMKGAPAQSTADVARELRLTMRDVDNLTRTIPLDELPPVERGRRRWEPAHVERLRVLVESRRAQKAS